jgi:hypothetical protein
MSCPMADLCNNAQEGHKAGTNGINAFAILKSLEPQSPLGKGFCRGYLQGVDHFQANGGWGAHPGGLHRDAAHPRMGPGPWRVYRCLNGPMAAHCPVSGQGIVQAPASIRGFEAWRSECGPE